MRQWIRSSSSARICFFLFLSAFLLRVSLVVLLKTYNIAPGDGFEMTNIARSLAGGAGYSSPFGEPTGPTAWASPLFPAMMAVCFKLFGVMTVKSALAIRLLNCLFSAASCALVYLAAKPVFGQRVALLSGAAFVVYPSSVWHAIRTTWDTTLLSMLLLLTVALLVRLAASQSVGFAALTGIAAGVMLLDNATPFFCYCLLLAWYGWVTWRMPLRWRRLAVLAGVPILAAGSWTCRNYFATGALVPRCCAGVELMVGNNEDSWERADPNNNQSLHPATSAVERGLYVKLGEAAYDRFCRQRGLAFISRNPGKALDLLRWKIGAWWLGSHAAGDAPQPGTLAMWLARWRIAVYWTLLPFLIAGVVFAVRRRVRLSYPYLIIVFVYPIPMYLFWVGEHLHLPVEAFTVTMACYGALELAGFRRAGPARSGWSRTGVCGSTDAIGISSTPTR
jgi:4-amino-4-deoxy-L-arabinose transferase-like glycosyltransferase